MKFTKYIRSISISLMLITASVSLAQSPPLPASGSPPSFIIPGLQRIMPPGLQRLLPPGSQQQQLPTQTTLPPRYLVPGVPQQNFGTWDRQAVLELTASILVTSRDIKNFFIKYPDFIADHFGGLAYNAKEFLLNIDKMAQGYAQFAFASLVRKFNPRYPLPIPDGLQNVCTSPRICIGLQYKVTESLMSRFQQNSKISYYFGALDNGNHNFIIALPSGIKPTLDNVRSRGVILDPWTYQSAEPKNFVFPGNHSYYSNMQIDITRVTPDYFQLHFPNDPFFSSTEPTPNPTPEPDPTPVPPPVCDNNPYLRDSYGGYIFKMNDRGVMAQVMASDVVTIAYTYSDKESGTIYRSFSGYGTFTKCDFEANKDKYISEALQSMQTFNLGNCLGVYELPAGSVLASFIDTYFDRMSLICL